MRTLVHKSTHAAMDEITSLTLDVQEASQCTIRCVDAIGGDLKTYYIFDDGTAELHTSDAATAGDLLTVAFGYKVGKIEIRFVPGGTGSGVLRVEATTAK